MTMANQNQYYIMQIAMTINAKLESIKLLFRILDNIINNPNESKYRKLNLNFILNNNKII